MLAVHAPFLGCDGIGDWCAVVTRSVDRSPASAAQGRQRLDLAGVWSILIRLQRLRSLADRSGWVYREFFSVHDPRVDSASSPFHDSHGARNLHDAVWLEGTQASMEVPRGQYCDARRSCPLDPPASGSSRHRFREHPASFLCPHILLHRCEPGTGGKRAVRMERKALSASRRASAPGRPVSPLRRVTPEQRSAQNGVLLCMKRRSAGGSRSPGVVSPGALSSFGFLF